MISIARNPYYSIDVDREQNRMIVRILDEIHSSLNLLSLGGDVQRAIAQMEQGFSVLACVRQEQVSPEVMDALRHTLDLLHRSGVGRVAKVNESGAGEWSPPEGLRMDYRRFNSLEAGEMWLNQN